LNVARLIIAKFDCTPAHGLDWLARGAHHQPATRHARRGFAAHLGQHRCF
jgi:hypothetical protein